MLSHLSQLIKLVVLEWAELLENFMWLAYDLPMTSDVLLMTFRCLANVFVSRFDELLDLQKKFSTLEKLMEFF